MASSGFWNDRRRAGEAGRQLRALKDSITSWETLKVELDDLGDLQEMAAAEGDENALAEIEGEVASLSSRIGELELHSTLSEGDDRKNAILDINSGAGGTEAADWAAMLMRMYMRWIERRSFQSDIMDLQAGEEAGIRSVTVEVKGEYAYGFLKAEAGVHRLVRISPFDANSRRHTSFASVFVYPEVEDEVEVDLRDEDLQIEVFRAGGAGGQHVNKTSSAVRIRHLPTESWSSARTSAPSSRTRPPRARCWPPVSTSTTRRKSRRSWRRWRAPRRASSSAVRSAPTSSIPTTWSRITAQPARPPASRR